MTYAEPIPDRADLLRQIERANRLAGPWVVVQLALAVVLGWAVDWRVVVDSPLLSVVAAGIIVGPHVMSVLMQWALKKKEIGDLKETTRFGEFDKHRLRALVDDTLGRLGLPPPGPPVYVTADKTLNAGALHLGLGGFLRSLNGVYLNRQVLHRLTAAEVQDVIGHELGHFYRYYLLNQRFQGLTLLVGGLAGLLVAQWIGLSSLFGIVALSICGSACWYVSGKLYAGNIEAIEYLCDDFGAHVHGVVTSINGLLKIGADSELQLAIHQQELLTRRHKNLSARDVVEAIAAAIPYGHTSREDLDRAVTESLKRRSLERQQVSIKGFLEYAWQGDDEDELETEMKKVRALQAAPRIDWESLLDRPGVIALNERRIEELVALLVAHPEQLLFRLPEEAGRTDDVHPPLRMRILYLWNNRREIEAAGSRFDRR
jgi:Zn-dependent protease with chaperone function